LDDEVKPPILVLGGGVGDYVIEVADSGDCAVKGRNSSSVPYQKSVLAFAGFKTRKVFMPYLPNYNFNW
jgi:hypothetical protein